MLEMLFKRSGARRERWLSENSHGGKICTTYAGCESQCRISQLHCRNVYIDTSEFVLRLNENTPDWSQDWER